MYLYDTALFIYCTEAVLYCVDRSVIVYYKNDTTGYRNDFKFLNDVHCSVYVNFTYFRHFNGNQPIKPKEI